jgi:hypothetical protein
MSTKAISESGDALDPVEKLAILQRFNADCLYAARIRLQDAV